jgi:beta-galactosidase
MKRFTFLTIILLAATVASAQSNDELSARNVEPARARLIPYNNMAGAVEGKTSLSRYVANVEELTRTEAGTTVTFTTYFPLSVTWLNRQVVLRVGYASMAYTLYVNSQEVGYAPSGVMGAEFNITKFVKEGRNEVSIQLDSSLLANKLYESKEFKVAGIEVFSQPTIRVRDIAVTTTLNEQGEGIAEFAIPMKCDALNSKSTRLYYALRLGDKLLTEGYRDMTLDMRREDTVRFACVVPKNALWSASNPTLLRLDVESRIDNRIAECISREVGLREIALQDKALYINKELVPLNLVEWEEIKSVDKAKKKGYNGIVITLDESAEQVIAECAKRGLYVIVRTPIDTTLLGDNIKRGGNPSNDPMWNDSYIWRNTCVLNSTKGCCAIIGYEIAKGNTSGINIYDSYVLMKSLLPNHLIIYTGAAGEWATDISR